MFLLNQSYVYISTQPVLISSFVTIKAPYSSSSFCSSLLLKSIVCLRFLNRMLYQHFVLQPHLCHCFVLRTRQLLFPPHLVLIKCLLVPLQPPPGNRLVLQISIFFVQAIRLLDLHHLLQLLPGYCLVLPTFHVPFVHYL